MMKKKIILIINSFLIIMGIAIVTSTWGLESREIKIFAQGGGSYGKGAAPIYQSPCWTKSYFQATPEQLQSLENLQRSFYKEISPMRSQYYNLYYELRSRLNFPQADINIILEKQRELAELQKKIDEISIQYFLKARNFFRPEQLTNLPSGCSLGFNFGQGVGWGRRSGPRYR